jgi:hypothetical protein
MSQHKESFVRWQAITIEQLGYAINLFLTFATASLAFSLVEFKGQAGSCFGFGKCLLFSAIIFFLFSIGIGAWCVINRLQDFRKTKDIARDREHWTREKMDVDEIDKRLEIRRAAVERLGRATWVLFYMQMGFFGLGVVFLSGGMAGIYCIGQP